MSIHGVAKGPPTTNPPSAPQDAGSASKSLRVGDLPFRDGNVTINRSADGTPVVSPPSASIRSTGDGTWEITTPESKVYEVSADDAGSSEAEASSDSSRPAAGPPTTNPPQVIEAGPPTTNPTANS